MMNAAVLKAEHRGGGRGERTGRVRGGERTGWMRAAEQSGGNERVKNQEKWVGGEQKEALRLRGRSGSANSMWLELRPDSPEDCLQPSV
jgi:hypothetical protein